MKNFKILFLSLALAVSLSGCQIPFTAKQITLPFLEKEPAEVLALMFGKMLSNASDYSFETEIGSLFRVDDFKYEFQENPDGVGLGSLKREKTGQVRTTSFTDQVSGKIKRSADGQIDFQQDLEMEIDIDESMSFKLGMNFIRTDEENFFKINKFPQLGLMFLPEDIKDKWILIATSGSLSAFQFDLSQLSGEASSDQQKIENIMDKVKGSVKESDLVEFVARLADEKIDNENCYHYRIKLNRAAIDKIFEVFFTEVENNFSEEEGFAEGFKTAKEILGTWKTILKEEGGEFWVDKKDFYLRKYSFALKFDLAQSEELKKIFQENDPSSAEVAEYDFDVFDFSLSVGGRFFDFNKGIKIEKPAEYKDFKEIMSAALSPFEESFSDSRALSRDARRVADIKQAQTALELYYNDESRYPTEVVFDGASSIRSTSTTYMMIVPANPQPANDGSCLADFNYQYEISADPASYTIKYCLGSDTGGLTAGEHIATPAGLSDDEGSFDINNNNTQEEESGDGDSSFDADSDGLDEFSEEIFGTDPNNPDTDGDGYPDGSEVENGYNPAGPGTLDDFYKEQMGGEDGTIAL